MLKFIKKAKKRASINRYNITNQFNLATDFEYCKSTGLYYISNRNANNIVVFDSNWLFKNTITANNPIYMKCIQDDLYYTTGSNVKKLAIYSNGVIQNNNGNTVSSNLNGNFAGITYDENQNLIIVADNSGKKICYFNRNLVFMSSISISEGPWSIGWYNNKVYAGISSSLYVIDETKNVVKYTVNAASIDNIAFDQYGYMLLTNPSNNAYYLYYLNTTYTGLLLQATITPLSGKFDSTGRFIGVGFSTIEIFY